MIHNLINLIMKKQFLLLAGFVLALVSCSKENNRPSAVENDGINFYAGVGTRADVTTASLDAIQVMIDYPATGVTETDISDVFNKDGSDFTSTINHRWPTSASAAVKFYAYAPILTALSGATESLVDHKVSNIEISANIAQQQDIVTAYNEGTKQNNEKNGVGLTFKHALSKMSIFVKNNSAISGYNVELSAIKLGCLKNKATLALQGATSSAPTWESLANDSYSEATFSAVTVPTDAASTATAVSYFLPQTVTGWKGAKNNSSKEFMIQVKIKVTDAATTSNVIFPKNGNNEDYTAVAFDQAFEIGKHYKVTLDFTNGIGMVGPDYQPGTDDPLEPGKPVIGGPIKFTTTVSEWTETPLAPDMSDK